MPSRAPRNGADKQRKTPQADPEPAPDEGKPEISPRTQEALHLVAEGVSSLLEAWNKGTQKARDSPVGHSITQTGHRIGERTRDAARSLKRSGEKALEKAHLKREPPAREKAKRFYEEHKEEIQSLVATALKVGVAIGKKRLEERRPDDEQSPPAARSLKEASKAVASDAAAELARIVREEPESLPILRHLYDKGGEGRGLALDALPEVLLQDPQRVLDEVKQVLRRIDAAQEIEILAERALRPAVARNPEFVELLKPWLKGPHRQLQQAALVAYLGALKDEEGRVGDVLTAASVVLQENGHEVQAALGRLVEEASRIDPKATAAWLEERLASARGAARRSLEQTLPRLGRDAKKALQERIDRLEEQNDD